MNRFPYFTTPECVDGQPAPEPLSFTVGRTVRFDEVDMMAVLWHGHYASYFEDARVALGNFYGIGYHQMIEHNVMAPVRQMYVDYRAPLGFADHCRITALLHWHEGARINIAYRLENGAGITAATGYSVQMFIDERRQVMLEPPGFLKTLCRNWKAGNLPRSRG